MVKQKIVSGACSVVEDSAPQRSAGFSGLAGELADLTGRRERHRAAHKVAVASATPAAP